MRHYKKGRKLGTDASHTKAMKKNLAVALFTNDRIKTTVTRAKEVRGDIDRIITWAKKGDLHSRRLAIAALGDKELVREVFEKAEQGMWADRNGGYTRIMKLGPRKGDNAPMAILELVEEAVVPKAQADDKPAKKSAAKKGAKSEDKTADEIEDLIEEGTEDKNDNDKDDVEEFAEGEEDRIDSIAESDVREDAVEAEKAEGEASGEDAVEAEKAEDEASVEDAVLEAKEAEVAKAEAENIEKIKEEVAEEERELIDDVNPMSKEEHALEDADEKAEKHEDDE